MELVASILYSYESFEPTKSRQVTTHLCSSASALGLVCCCFPLGSNSLPEASGIAESLREPVFLALVDR